MSQSAADILVIGAGPAGLAVSACLRKEGVAHTVLEREQRIAPSWHRHYDRLHLHTVKQYSTLPYSRWPIGTPKYPSRQQFVDYLAAYAAQHDIRPQFGVEVRSVEKRDEGFAVYTNTDVLTPTAVVIASGYNNTPFIPDLPGLDRFGGTVIHSSAYRNPAPFVGKRTLVVGCGNSGAEIALDLAEHDCEVSMVVRGPVHVVPRDLLGRPIQSTNIALSHLPLALRDALAGLMLRLVMGDLSRWGIVRPKLGPNTMIERFGRVPILDIGTIAMIKRGKIKVMPGVAQVMPHAIMFADQKETAFDALIFATGFQTGLQKLIKGFDEISDETGRPHRFGAETSIAGLYLVGFRNSPSGALREIGIEARRVATTIRLHNAVI